MYVGLHVNYRISNSIKIRCVGAQLFHADGRTDGHITKLVVAFRNFVNAPRTNQLMLSISISSLSAI